MKAKDVYNRHGKEINVITEHMRKSGRPGVVDVKGLSVHSAQPFEPGLEFLSSLTVMSEIVGLRTMCQVVAIGEKDLKLTCIETEDDTEKLRKCISPIAEDIAKELANLAIEQETTVKEVIVKTRKGQITNEEASKEMKERLKSSYRDEEEILSHYKSYRDKHCGKVNKTLSKVEIKGGKIIETETKSSKPIEL